jgi:hypothetical protein
MLMIKEKAKHTLLLVPEKALRLVLQKASTMYVRVRNVDLFHHDSY